MGGRWPCSCCFVGCCLQDLFNIACSILVELPSSLFSSRLVSIHVVHLYSSIDMIAAEKKLRFILLVRSDFHMTDSLLIAVHAFASHVSMSVSVVETLLLPKFSLYIYIYIYIWLNIIDCWRCKDELISDVLLWTPTRGHTSDDCPASTSIRQLCTDTRGPTSCGGW